MNISLQFRPSLLNGKLDSDGQRDYANMLEKSWLNGYVMIMIDLIPFTLQLIINSDNFTKTALYLIRFIFTLVNNTPSKGPIDVL